MSLIEERDFSAWVDAARKADLTGLLDLHGQASVVRDRDPELALALMVEIGDTAMGRLAEGTIEPHTVDRYFRLTLGLPSE